MHHSQSANDKIETNGISLGISRVSTSEKLVSALRQVNISVPPRTEGRRTHHTEVWTFCRLLSTLANYDQLSFPVTVNHRDRPDFLIEFGDTVVGVEVTEAISKQFAAFCALAEREFPDVFVEPAHFRWGAPKLTVEEMRSLLRKSHLTSDGWVGDRPEQEWALFVQSVVGLKLAKLTRPGFAHFDQNWLAVYDNLPLPNIHLGKAIAILQPLVQDCWSRVPGFDVLFIEHGPVIAQVTENSADHLILNDLWE